MGQLVSGVSGITKVLLLGASGMLGSTLYRYILAHGSVDLLGTERGSLAAALLPQGDTCRIVSGVDAENSGRLGSIMKSFRPTLMVNCITADARADALEAISLNALLPHRLACLCAAAKCRLIHISTDGVFSGKKGGYVESDLPDADDLYGRSKLLGEIDYPHAITLRTSMIGHELHGVRSLISWFLAQQGGVRGFTRAIFSGLPTVEVARIINTYVLPNPELNGLYHLSVDPISKYDLLSMVKDVYRKQIEIIPDDSLMIDRSLNSSRFRQATGFVPKPWPELIQAMRDFR